MEDSLSAAILDINSSLPERKLNALIERTNLSADMKALLSDLTKLTVKVGGKILAVGRKIIGFCIDLIKAFPTVTLGIVMALVITSLLASIPILGLLAAPLGSLLLLLGVSAGALKDFTSDKLSDRIDALVVSFSALGKV
jgi:hypothetical protein